MHLYPDLLNLYGDLATIRSLCHRLQWRGINAEVITHTSENGTPDFGDIDIIVLGGGTDREEKTVMNLLLKQKDELKAYVDSEKVIFATCGGMDMLGKYCKFADETVEGPGILDIHTESGTKRMTGDVVVESNVFDGKIVGFENRSGKTNIGSLTPLGKVVTGGGNNGEDFTEGVVYKNVIATHLHGALLPKNPKLCDYILETALRKKYMEFSKLTPLSDELETEANKFIVKRYEK